VSGQRKQAERQIADAVGAGELGPSANPGINNVALILAAVADDDLAAAAQHVVDARALLPERILFVPFFVGGFYALAAVVLAAQGATTLVEGRDWLPFGDVFVRSSFDVARAIVAGRTEHRQQATELFVAADERLARIPWFQALYRRYAAEAAIQDEWGQPREWLLEATKFFHRYGNPPLARACRSLLRLTGTSPPRRHAAPSVPRFPGGELTSREADVLALVAQGLTNRQVAARLYLSARTVEKHVERILAKTGLANRTALATFAIEGQAGRLPD
jgi:DNA-binding CsgD family transcriptional regulator